jgi:hypothetical protein
MTRTAEDYLEHTAYSVRLQVRLVAQAQGPRAYTPRESPINNGNQRQPRRKDCCNSRVIHE